MHGLEWLHASCGCKDLKLFAMQLSPYFQGYPAYDDGHITGEMPKEFQEPHPSHDRA